mgnify:CR=1 FL=1
MLSIVKNIPVKGAPVKLTTLIHLGSVTLYKSAIFTLFVSALIIAPDRVYAIPSPELVIGSVSSLSQVFAVGIAMVTGTGAMLATRLGLAPKHPVHGRVFPKKLITGLVFGMLALGMLNFWQYTTQKTAERARLEATLVRPAQFDGTKIQDATLKETSFDNQSQSPHAITTSDAADLLLNPSDTLFFDVRETGENAMGTLPGASHVRYPDFLQSNIPLEGKQVVLFCHNGNRSSETCAELAARGIDCRFIAGGIEKWIVEGRPFSDKDVKTLSDLRAIPDYQNKSTLLDTSDFTTLLNQGDLQILDTRYPGDFATGHLPGAINIPLRALPTTELKQRIAALNNSPIVTACYDRRSCFMAQVLGLELSQAGLDFQGRYTTPWEYFVAPPPKQHVQDWLNEKQETLWQKAITALAGILLWIHAKSHILWGLFALSLLSRILVLPIALKSERDQIITAQCAGELSALKKKLQHDSARKARAVQAFYKNKGLTPMRNLIALLFLPVMMLGLSATQQASQSISVPFAWMNNIGIPDPLYILPVLFGALAGVYLYWAVAKTPRQTLLWLGLGVPALFAMVYQLSATANIYLCFSLSLLLVQRAYVIGMFNVCAPALRQLWQHWKLRRLFRGVYPLSYTKELQNSGNKSLRLSILKNAGLPVPDGVVLRSDAIAAYRAMPKDEKAKFALMIWQLIGMQTCAVRSSASSEDGADQSFAGVFESILFVRKKGMRMALDAVVASFSADRVASYESAIDHTDQGNILVQQMIDAQFAGVLFTQDPQAPGMQMLEMVKGSGDDLVSGRVTPTSLRFGRYTALAHPDNAATDIDLAPLLDLGRQIEQVFGCPQDIEWAYAEGTFYIVQSRDITTLALGTEAEQLRVAEWAKTLDRYKDADAKTIILEQDEMSEVLPRPTPLSLSLMGTLWAPGGSVDLACRQLGVPYDLPEGEHGHLVTFFGKTYVDTALKQQMALRLSKQRVRQLKKRTLPLLAQFREITIPYLEGELTHWRALNYAALPAAQLIICIQKLHSLLAHDVYVEAEKINIIAGFTMSEAIHLTPENGAARNRLMRAELPHAPSSLIAACAQLNEPERRTEALRILGHRSIFDYELSTPRYDEAPDLLWPLLEASIGTEPAQFDLGHPESDPVALAIAYQDLKEQAKHESLRIIAEIRRAVLALGQMTGLEELVFHLNLDEICKLDRSDLTMTRKTAQKRKTCNALCQPLAPPNVSLTLQECEILSLNVPIASATAGPLSGTCVAGSKGITGRVFHVFDETSIDPKTFDGFQDGDILVCRMVNPAWLPTVQRAGAVLSEVGGWLSHMAIVAREKDVLMLVGCKGISQLKSGTELRIEIDGEIQLLSGNQEQARSA